MELSILLIIIGIVLAVFVHYALGIVCILIGLVLLIWPRITAAADASSRSTTDAGSPPALVGARARNCTRMARSHNRSVISARWPSASLADGVTT